MFLLRLVGVEMADEAPDTISGGVKATLGTFGFLLPMCGLEQLLSPSPPILPPWGSMCLIISGPCLYFAPAIWRRFHERHPDASITPLPDLRNAAFSPPSQADFTPMLDFGQSAASFSVNADTALSKILIASPWMLDFNPSRPDGKKEISFLSDGRIGAGANSNEYRWHVLTDTLRIFRATGELQNDFRFDATKEQFFCTNNAFAKGTKD